MLYPERMQKIALVVHGSDLPSLVAELHEAGVLKIREIDPDIADITRRMHKPLKEAKLSSLHVRLRRILDFLEQVKKTRAEKEGILLRLRGAETAAKREVEYTTPERLASKAEKIIEPIEGEVKVLEGELDTVNERVEKLEEYLSILRKLEPLKVDLRDLLYSYEWITVRVGIIPEFCIPELEKSETDEIIFHIERIDEKQSLVLVLALKEREEELNALLERLRFEQLKIPELEGTAVEALRSVKRELEELREKERKLLDRAYLLAKEKEEDLLVLKEELDIELRRFGVYPLFHRTGTTAVLEAWVPEKNMEKVEEIVRRETDGAFLLEKLEFAEEEPPTLLNNPSPVKNFEALTEMYGMPRYREVDPTIFFAIFYPLVFGFMLGDTIYGLILAALAYLTSRLIPGLKGLTGILLFGALWSVLFGVLMGSYLGDFMPRILGLDISAPWVNPFGVEESMLMGHPISPVMLILVVSVIFGALHMNIGIFISLRDSIMLKDYRRTAGDIGKLILEIGLLLVLFKFFGVRAITDEMFMMGMKLVAVGAVLLLVQTGPLGLFDTTGFLADLISYSRILALNMATGGLALAVNVSAIIMGSLMGLVPPGGEVAGVAQFIMNKIASNPLMLIPALVFVGILTVGHIACLAINTLGGAIHTLRLHYAEFFSKFYEGGGAKYLPFHALRERTVLVEKGGEKDGG